MDSNADDKYKIVSTVSKDSAHKTLVLLISEKCNNNCLFCFIPECWRNRRFAKFEDIKKLIDLQENRDIYIQLGEAEPTLHPQFFEILRYLRDKNFEVLINSNARLFSYPSFSKKIGEIGGIRVKSSLHGHTAEIHDSLTRTAGSFDQAMKGFENILKNKMPLMVNIVINKKNLTHLRDIVDALYGIGVREISFSGLILKGDLKTDKEITPSLEEIAKNLPPVLDYSLKKGMITAVEKLPICIAPKFSELFLIDSSKTFFVKFKSCSKCKYEPRCIGVNKLYIREEFPVRINPQ